MNNFLQQGLTKYLEKTELSKIKNTKILIAGAGGVGSNAAMLLVRCGFEKITIIDDDELEPSNLNRQFFFNEQVGTLKVCGLKENLLKINHQATITIIKERLTVDNVNNLIKNQDIILEAFDDIIAKKIIVEACHLLAKHIIAVSGIAGIGNSDKIVIRKINNRFYMVGDFESDINLALPPLAPKVMIAAAKQVDIVLELVIGNKEIAT